ncbi:MAG: YgiT-type zinc finger protein [Rubritalea sp.]
MDAWSCVVLRKLGFKTNLEIEGKAVTVPKVEMERCDNCGETFLTPAGRRHVDDLNNTI